MPTFRDGTLVLSFYANITSIQPFPISIYYAIVRDTFQWSSEPVPESPGTFATIPKVVRIWNFPVAMGKLSGTKAKPTNT